MTKLTSVLFIWELKQELRNHLENQLGDIDGLKLVFTIGEDEEMLDEHARQADIIIGWKPSERLLRQAENMRLFISPGAGVQHLIEPFRLLNRERSVTLVNGHGNSYFTAQHTVAMLLALMNKVVPHHNWMMEGRWRTGDAEAASLPLRGRKVGLLGYGAVNSKVRRMLSGFDVSFTVLKRNWGEDDELEQESKKFDPVDLSEFLRVIDILIIAVPETELTRGLIGKDELEILGAEGLLVNVSRGRVVAEGDLYKALQNRTIQGAALDVWYNYQPDANEAGEKRPYQFPFHELNNTIMSPHRAASPFNDLPRWDEVVENIRRFKGGRRDFLNIVDLEREY